VPEEYLYTVVDALDQAAQETGETVPQIALDWLLQRPAVANVIVGAWNEGGAPWPLTIFGRIVFLKRGFEDLPICWPLKSIPS